MDTPDTSPGWEKGRYCEGGHCPEVKAVGDVVFFRSSRSGLLLTFDKKEWNAFIRGVKEGDFNFPEEL